MHIDVHLRLARLRDMLHARWESNRGERMDACRAVGRLDVRLCSFSRLELRGRAAGIEVGREVRGKVTVVR